MKWEGMGKRKSGDRRMGRGRVKGEGTPRGGAWVAPPGLASSRRPGHLVAWHWNLGRGRGWIRGRVEKGDRGMGRVEKRGGKGEE